MRIPGYVARSAVAYIKVMQSLENQKDLLRWKQMNPEQRQKLLFYYNVERQDLHEDFMEALDRADIPYRNREHATDLAYQISKRRVSDTRYLRMISLRRCKAIRMRLRRLCYGY